MIIPEAFKPLPFEELPSQSRGEESWADSDLNQRLDLEEIGGDQHNVRISHKRVLRSLNHAAELLAVELSRIQHHEGTLEVPCKR